MTELIRLTPAGPSWAIRHNDGFLGYARTREEAVVIGHELVSWLNGQGRSAALAIEDQGGAPHRTAQPEQCVAKLNPPCR